MLRSIVILILVSILLVSMAAPASADASRLFLPALGRNPAPAQPVEYGTLFGHAFCASGIVPAGVWLWYSAYSTVVAGDGSFLIVAPVGTAAAIYYGQLPVSSMITVQSGRQYIGTVTLPC